LVDVVESLYCRCCQVFRVF